VYYVRSLVDFLSCYPTILSKAAPHNAATAGFIDNGMIDTESYSYPDLNSIVNTYYPKLVIR